MAGQLSAFAGLRALRHFNLQLSRIHEIVGGDTEPGRRHLLDIGIFRVAVRQRHKPLRVFAAFARIALRADAVHRDRQRFVCFLADRAERHGARRKAFDDLLGGLHFLDRNRRLGELKFQQPAKIGAPSAFVIDERGKFLKGLGVVRARRVLQLINGLRVPIMVFPLTR